MSNFIIKQKKVEVFFQRREKESGEKVHVNTVERESFKFIFEIFMVLFRLQSKKNGTFEETLKQPQIVDQVIKTYII